MHLARLGSGAGSPVSPRERAAAAGGSSTAGSAAAAAGDDGWSVWQRRRRHFFVLTAAGKPVFSRHGDEQALAGFMAVIQALVSVVADQGDSIQSISVGNCELVFLLAGQLYLVAVSSRGEAPAALRRQLQLLYQSILMVVTGGIEKLLQRSAGYDLQQLLAGSKPSLSALTSAFSDCPGWMLGSVEPAAATAADRQAAAAALSTAVKTGEALYGVLLVGRRLLAAAAGKGPPPLNVFDLLLLVNFANSNESLRHSETFVPVCLPNFQPNAFLHAYITNIEPGEHQQQQQQQRHSHKHPHDACPSSIFLLLLSGSADSFHKLSAAKQAFAAAMAATPPAGAAAVAAAAAGGGAGDGTAAAAAAAAAAPQAAAAAAGGGVLARAQAAGARLPGGGRLRVEALPPPLGGPVGSTPLWHAVVRFPQRKQHLTLNFPQELFTARTASSAAGGMGSGAAAAAAAAAAYMLPYGAMGVPRSHKLVWVSSERWVTGVIVDREVEVYVTFDPLTEKDVGLKLAESLRRLFADKARQQELLVPGL
ncbi:hypothetical protein OEZ86_004619 [Tetradesmus obliquus]|nr:hypothetical protein OEZ86_004619 [Tetradesmus obliquus]